MRQAFKLKKPIFNNHAKPIEIRTKAGLKIHRISMKKQCTEACWHVTEVNLLKWFLWGEVQSKREGMCVYLPNSVHCIAENNQINQKLFIEKWIFNKKKPCTYKILQDYECSNNNGQSLFVCP